MRPSASDLPASATPVRPQSELIDANDVHSAYAVQQFAHRRSIAAVAGMSSAVEDRSLSSAVQQQLGVDQPDFGSSFADMDASTKWYQSSAPVAAKSRG